MLLVLRIPVRMVGLLLVVEPDERQQEEPCRDAERPGQGGDSDGRHQHIHAGLNEHRHQNSQNGPERRTEIRLVEHRRQRNGRQHGAVLRSA